MSKNTKTPRWDMLQSAQFHLFDAAKYALQALALEGQGHNGRGYETLSREAFFNAADALGYTVTPKPQRPANLIPATDIQPGDVVNGAFTVGDVSHGPLDHQIRLRSPDETATIFLMDHDLVLVDREVRS